MAAADMEMAAVARAVAERAVVTVAEATVGAKGAEQRAETRVVVVMAAEKAATVAPTAGLGYILPL
jgi:hypothetical protein